MAESTREQASPSSTKTNEVKHLCHNHPLIRVGSENDDDEFLCGGCNTLGSGVRYRCKEKCNFNIHEECATSHEYLMFPSIHDPSHVLKLMWVDPDDDKKVGGRRRPCSVCGDQIEGLFYSCPSCQTGFFIHPLCSNFPSQLPDVMHHKQKHVLKLQSSASWEHNLCTICSGICSSCRYRCSTCGINFHLECVITIFDDNNLCTSTSPSQHPLPACSPPPHVVQRSHPSPPPHYYYPPVPYYYPPMYQHYQPVNYNYGHSPPQPQGSGRRKIYKVVRNIGARMLLSTVLFGSPLPFLSFS